LRKNDLDFVRCSDCDRKHVPRSGFATECDRLPIGFPRNVLKNSVGKKCCASDQIGFANSIPTSLNSLLLKMVILNGLFCLA